MVRELWKGSVEVEVVVGVVEVVVGVVEVVVGVVEVVVGDVVPDDARK